MREGWIEVELSEICEINMGQSPPSSTYNDKGDGLPFFQGKAEFTDLHPVAVKWCSVPKKIAEKGDVLLSVRAPVGSTNIANTTCAIGRGLASIRYKFGYKFIWFFLKLIEKKLDAQGTGTTFKAISGQVLKSQKIPLPPLPEQRAIVSRIEELFSELDHSIANLKSAQTKLEIYRQAVMKKAFEGGFTSVKKLSWRQIRLGEILKVSSGKGLTSSQMDSGIYSVYGGNGKNGSHSEYLFEEPKLIIGRVGVRCGVTHITLPFSWVTDNALVVDFKLEETHDIKFMKLKLEFENLNKLSNSTAQPVISGSKIYDYSVFIPSYEEQTQIVQEIESRLSVADKMADTIETNLKKSESLRQSILKRAFEGKLLSEAELKACRKEADWEPAERLLKKIKI